MKNWQEYTDKTHLEIMISPKCNLNCKYCYLRRFEDGLYPEDIYDEEKIFENTIKIIHWLGKNNYRPELNLFSGELFAQSIGYRIMDEVLKIYTEHPEYSRPAAIIIPSNFTFILSDELTKKVEYYIEEFKKQQVNIGLSASLDGLYMENINRAYNDCKTDMQISGARNQAFYDKVFAFCKKHGCGLHPMIYSNNIENWKKNFDWFMEMHDKHNIDWRTLYLLEVRDYNWNREQIEQYADLLVHMLNYAYDRCQREGHDFISYFYKRNENNHWNMAFNILFSLFCKTGTGVSCSLQNSVMIRAADMKHFPCHRLSYPEFLLGKFDIDDDYNGKYTCENMELMIGMYSFDPKTQPICSDCTINTMCVHGCHGSQYETNKETFVPIPSVCNLFYKKVYTIVNWFIEKELFSDLLGLVSPDSRLQLIHLYEEIIGEKNND